MRRIRVKVTGVTHRDDALEAAHLGVDAVGFHLGDDDPRRVPSEELPPLLAALPPWVVRVAVAEAARLDALVSAIPLAGLDALEVRDPPGPASLRRLPLRAYPSLELHAGFEPRSVVDWPVGPLLLRARGEGAGELMARWTVAQQASAFRPVLLGGLLGASTVELAVRTVRPHGVDLGESVEREPGRLDLERLERTLETLRRIEGG